MLVCSGEQTFAQLRTGFRLDFTRDTTSDQTLPRVVGRHKNISEKVIISWTVCWHAHKQLGLLEFFSDDFLHQWVVFVSVVVFLVTHYGILRCHANLITYFGLVFHHRAIYRYCFAFVCCFLLVVFVFIYMISIDCSWAGSLLVFHYVCNETIDIIHAVIWCLYRVRLLSHKTTNATHAVI